MLFRSLLGELPTKPGVPPEKKRHQYDKPCRDKEKNAVARGHAAAVFSVLTRGFTAWINDLGLGFWLSGHFVCEKNSSRFAVVAASGFRFTSPEAVQDNLKAAGHAENRSPRSPRNIFSCWFSGKAASRQRAEDYLVKLSAFSS